MLTINAANEGEGAYEAELHVTLPPEADYIGVERRREVSNITLYLFLLICVQDIAVLCAYVGFSSWLDVEDNKYLVKAICMISFIYN